MATPPIEKELFPQRSVIRSKTFVSSFKAKADASRNTSEKFGDMLVSGFGTNKFLLINAVIFTVWVVLNINVLPFARAFDPFPFGFLTLSVSLEAIFLSIIVLISQNRAAKVSDLREEMDIQIDVITEDELTKALQILKMLAEKQGIDLSKDIELENMIKPTDKNVIEEMLKKEIS